jgi:hypothetical protein
VPRVIIVQDVRQLLRSAPCTVINGMGGRGRGENDGPSP